MGIEERPPDAGSVGRRGFVRKLAGEAVGAAGHLAGMGQVVHGSMLEAGRAFSEGMTSIRDGATPTPGATSAPRSDPAAPPPATPPVVAELTPEIRQILERAETAVMAANQPGSAPQLSVSRVWFDGEAIRLPSRAMTARVANLQRDPRVTLAIIDEESGDAVVVGGRVELVYGDEARTGLAALWGTGDGDSATGDVVTPGDGPVLIVLRPERVVRRHAEGRR